MEINPQHKDKSHEISAEEADNLDRSAKKIKRSIEEFKNTEALTNYRDIYSDEEMEETAEGEPILSFKEKLLGVSGKEKDKDKVTSSLGHEEEEVEEELSINPRDFKIVEDPDPEIDCPEFVFSTRVEKVLAQDFEYALVVCLLGKSIGFRALETRIKSMWAKRGIFTLVNLGWDHFLVNFSNAEDMELALMGGPWMIYDHYLIVKKWYPNFDPEIAKIDSVAAWIRIEKLPFAYYNEKVLEFMGDRFGRTVKVDVNTSERVRGKYARLCVEVNLNKPLTPCFKLKGKTYYIQYEGLHNLCLECGRYGHNKVTCPVRKRETEQREQRVEDDRSKVQVQGNNVPEKNKWTVVQKPRRQRQTREPSKEKTGSLRQNGQFGSRFEVLSELEGQASDGKNVENKTERRETAHSRPVKHQRENEYKKGANSKIVESNIRKGKGTVEVEEKSQNRGFTLAAETSDKRRVDRDIIMEDKLDNEGPTIVPETPGEEQLGYTRINGPQESEPIESPIGEEGHVQDASLRNGPSPKLDHMTNKQMGHNEMILVDSVDPVEGKANGPNSKLLVDKGPASTKSVHVSADPFPENERMDTSLNESLEASDSMCDAEFVANSF